LLQTANLAGAMGNSMAFIAIPWVVIEITGSATATGLVVGISFFPVIVVAPIAGVIIDRWGRRQVSILSDLLSGVSVALIPLMAALGNLTVAGILLAAVLGAVFDPAGYTARKTMIQAVAERIGMRLESANALHQALFALGFSIGPALAAGLIGVLGTENTFWVIAAMSVVAAGAVAILGPIREVRKPADQEGVHWLRDAVQGFVWLRRDRALLLLSVFFLAVEMVYLPSETVILPSYFSATNFPLGMGLVISSMALGGIIGSYAFGALSRRFTLRRIAVACILLASTTLFGLATFPPIWIMMISGFLVGGFWGPMGPLLNTLVQTRAPEWIHGRVFGAQMAVFSAGPPVGMILIGPMVDRWGVFVLYPALVAAVFVLGVIVTLLPVLKHLDRPQQGLPDS
jgi:MFS family permease